MSKMNEYPHGAFSWVDLVAHDLQSAKRWYAELFGWQVHDQDTEGGPDYAMCFLGDAPVAGIGQMSEEMKQQGVPPMWNNYISVDDAAAAEARAKQLGGTIQVPTMQVMNYGSMAFIQDPTGAMFGVWQAGEHKGSGVFNEPGSLCWNELATRDVEQAKGFYGELFNWSYKTSPMGEFDYTELQVGERSGGGMIPMIGDKWEGVPPHWMAYFAVADVDASAAKVAASGGDIKVPAFDIPNVGRMSVVSDPQGAVFTLIALSPKA